MLASVISVAPCFCEGFQLSACDISPDVLRQREYAKGRLWLCAQEMSSPMDVRQGAAIKAPADSAQAPGTLGEEKRGKEGIKEK